MTFLHFANCAGLAFGPTAVLFKALNISERGGTRSFLSGIAGYFLTQLAKLVLAAIVFSSYDVNANSFSWSQEVAATIFSTIDIVGAWWFLSKAGGASLDVKLLSFGLGWALGNNVAQYGPGLWIDARSLQFSWDHIQSALHANVSSILFLSFAVLVWMMTTPKKGDPSQAQSIITAAVVLVLVLDSVTKFLRVNQGINEWALIGFRAVWTGCLAFLTRILYSTVSAASTK